MSFDYSLPSNVITEVLGLLGPLILVAVSSFAITRNTRHLRLIAFPLALGYARIGLPINYIIIIALGIIWAVTLVGSYIIGSTLQSYESDEAFAPLRNKAANVTFKTATAPSKGITALWNYRKNKATKTAQKQAILTEMSRQGIQTTQRPEQLKLQQHIDRLSAQFGPPKELDKQRKAKKKITYEFETQIPIGKKGTRWTLER